MPTFGRLAINSGSSSLSSPLSFDADTDTGIAGDVDGPLLSSSSMSAVGIVVIPYLEM